MYAKKSLGQHFLTSEGALDDIIDAGDVMGEDLILEVGPGRGVLTKRLLETGARVVAVEKDDDLVLFLGEKFKKEIKNKQLELVHGDILDFELKEKSYKLIANIPYNITGPLIRKFLESNNSPERMVIMVQKEVAERVVAKDKKESILSISVKAYSEPKYVKTVKAGSFNPAPNVDSAILLIEDVNKDFFNEFTEKDFFELVRAGFKSKRKKLSSNLSEVAPKLKIEMAFQTLKLDPNLRAEDLDIKGWRELAKIILKKV